MAAIVARHSFGRTLHERRLGVLTVAEVAMPRGLVLLPHAHAAAQICFVREGHYVERGQGEIRTLGPGAVFLRPPAAVHANRFPEEARALLVDIPGRVLARWPALCRPRALCLPAGALEDLGLELAAELRRSDPASNLALAGLVRILLARAARLAAGPAEPSWLAAAARLVTDTSGGRMSLHEVAARAGVSPWRLRAALRRHRGASFRALMTEARVREAMRMLAGSDLPLRDVALEAGFYDQSHFGRVFRRQVGLTPARFRHRLRG